MVGILGSDHLPIFITMQTRLAPVGHRHAYTNYKRANWDKFTSETVQHFEILNSTVLLSPTPPIKLHGKSPTQIKEYQNTHLSLSLQHWYVDLITAVLGSRCHLHSLEHHPDFSIARTWRVEAHMELKRFLRRLQDTELKT